MIFVFPMLLLGVAWMFAGFNPFDFCRTRSGLPNCPPPEVWPDLSATARKLRRVWKTGLRITSGYRSPAVNLAAKGNEHSRHLAGRAVDVAGAVELLEQVAGAAQHNGDWTEIMLNRERGYLHLGHGDAS